MTERKEREADHLLIVCRRIQKRFKDGQMPTFEQMEHFDGAIEAFDFELLCGHKVIEECDCTEIAHVSRLRPQEDPELAPFGEKHS